MRLMVYSHDTFGLGNIRRMLAICNHLLDSIPSLPILLVSGSPMLQSFRLPQGLDYIKIPCLNRSEAGKLSVKYLGTETDETVKLRADLILAAASNFKPDLLLVDKKPNGIQGELVDTLNYLKTELPATKLVLLLRDILDCPEVTTKEWRNHGYHEAIQLFYDQVLVVGLPEVFDIREEYQFPASVSEKVRFCGYIRKEPGLKHRSVLREELQIKPDEELILVTPGGGQDGYRLIETYLSGLGQLPEEHNFRSLIVCGPEMSPVGQKAIYQAAEKYPHVQICEFTDDLMSYMDAADAIVAMGGYNTVSEILSLGKRAVIVPRIKPQEQWIRAERLARLGLIRMIHPDYLTPLGLIKTLLEQLSGFNTHIPPFCSLDLDALPRITYYISNLLSGEVQSLGYLYQKSLKQPCLATADQN